MADDDIDVRTLGLDAHRPDNNDVGRYGEEPPYSGDDGESADSIDPKRLVRTPSVDDIRWYYRNGPLAPTIVDKPVDDAFKHGYSVGNDNVEAFLNTIEEPFKRAHRKARRDGFALLWFRFRDTAEEWEPPENVKGIHEIKVLTLDDMTDAKPVAFEEKLSVGNRDGISDDINPLVTSNLEDLYEAVERAENGSLPLSDEFVKDESVVDAAIDSGVDLDAGLSDNLPYDRSRFYETTDSGIVMSERIDDKRFEEPIGYLYDRGAAFQPLLIHPSRVYHVAWRRDVDGNVNDETWGRYEGDSVLRPIIHLLRNLQKSNWANAQTMFRHSSPLHVMEVPEGASQEQYDKAEDATRNINAKSSITEPPNFDLRIEDNETNVDPEPHFNVIFDQICAGTEFTRSVLFGTQAGTVSGSETDIKNYFNKVERLREDRFEQELREIVDWWADISDGRTELGIPNDAADFDIDWGPLFKLSALDRAEAMSRHVQLVTTGASNYILSEEEARSILAEEWADWSSVELDGTLSESEKEALDRIDWDGNVDGNPRVGQNGGGMEQGQQTASEQVNTE
ncbi:DUF1073 domain-containing protein [Halorubrum ezzemoulense]|uniref:anti-CBASS protein Acb1 family protein n=1 Tax=Halorubrum ezzemoulense TaxID=337243 RepID=UPI00232DB3C4|nr:anti-CBASS Acb1 family protein [Halorubrum ezzemoulense]MDB9247461.1 DUF1073 domain-containing protein [Halorubrum ezzemoulense]MDB9258630.1 DUF1073 domain-containing protein [Halorubrum ezzemoulense]MDB9264512.1 DUF1073 domain-containing protein [Halorubrum ezzemoulense]MDB9268991.1 DUF1073 domain-containing protein [Halorubrum ezzemoulense]MDB9271480.1 DUF1073 domain-containing protein [Halorubrum ezzemoulense]